MVLRPNGTPLQHSRLGNPVDGGAWWAAVHGVKTERLHFHFHFHALEKEMATHSSVLAWRIPGTGEPGGLPSMGSHRVRHDWSELAWESIELDKAVVLVWLDWLVFCEYGFSVSALWCPLATPTVLLGFLLSWTSGISSRLLQQSAAAAPYLGQGVSPQYASRFGKLSSGHRTGKGQFSVQSQKRAMPKNVQTTAQLHSFHILAK